MVTKYAATTGIRNCKTEGETEEITGTPVTYFAYPFGFLLWNKEAIPEIKKSGYQMAFILSTKEIQSIRHTP
jgi:hypothetical protein